MRALFAALCIGALGCSDPRLEVQVSGLDAQVDSLRVQAALRERPDARVLTSVRGRLDSFILRLPAGLMSGTLELRVGGLGSDGCRRSEGTVAAQVPGGPLQIALKPLAQPGCRLQVSLLGEGKGRVRSDAVGDVPAGRLDCPGQCAATFPAGATVTLRATQDRATSYFTGWSQACAGLGDCAVTVPDDAATVSAGFLPKKICNDAFCWEAPLPHGNPILAVWTRSSNAVLTAGAGGVLLRSDGTAWAPLRTGVRADLRAIAARGDEVFVAGDAGTLLRVRLGDDTVSQIELPTVANLRAVATTAGGEIWLAGDSGTVLRGDGQSFTAVPTATTKDLYAIHARDGSVYVGGDNLTLLRWDGAALTPLLPSGDSSIRAILGRAPGELLLGMEYQSSGGVQRWDGTTLRQLLAVPTANFRALFGVPGGPLWAAGTRGTLLRGQGDLFSAVSSDVLVTLNGLAGSADNDIWAVGDAGVMMHWNGAAWISQRSVDTASLIAVGAFDATSEYTVSDRCALRNNQGGVWHPVSAGPFQDCIDATTDPGEVWAVGPRGLLMHYVERAGAVATWRAFQVANPTLRGVVRRTYDPTGKNVDIWAVGDFGRLIHAVGPEDNIQLVTSVALPNADGVLPTLDSMAWVSPTEAWIVGDLGTTWHLQGGQATLVASGTKELLLRVVALKDGGALAVGEHGVALRYANNGWTRLASGTTRHLRGLFVGAAGEVWVVGDGGTVLRFDGQAFTAVDPGTGVDLRSVYGRPDGTLLLAGQSGALLSRRR